MAYQIPDSPRQGSRDFQPVVAAFLSGKGLPFAALLDAEKIERVFAKHGGLFGLIGIYTTAVMVWSFLAQVLRDGKEASCQAAVARVVSFCEQQGLEAPTDDTGDDCRARTKLSEGALHELSCEVAGELELAADARWLWKGKHAKLIDGFTFTMPDTPANQAAYPQQRAQAPGVGLPIARAVAVLSLATGSALIRYSVVERGRRTKSIDLITTLTDANEYSAADLAQLYGFRWNSELDIRGIKSNLNLSHVRCKSPAMVGREVWATLLAYNLIRTTAAGAALRHGKQPRQISFTATCQSVLSSWMQLSCGLIKPSALKDYLRRMLRQIAHCEVANRPGRLEPRVLKRRRHGYKLMQKPRAVLRDELQRRCT